MLRALLPTCSIVILLLVGLSPTALAQWLKVEHEAAALPGVAGLSENVVIYGAGDRPRGDEPETVEYLYDDGAGNTNQGPPSTFDPDMLWGNYFLTEEGGEVITHISVAFGPTFPSLKAGPVTFWLLDDPDMDFDPQNATSLTSVEGTPDVFGNTFFTVEIPPTEVSGAFFVGASAQLLGGQDRPARVDTNARADRSWFFYAPDISAVIDDLASAPFGTRMDNQQFVILPGAFMIRAVGRPAAATSSAPEAGSEGFRVDQNHPNPFAGQTSITFAVPRAERVSLSVYDLTGRRVATLVDQELEAGIHTARWNASGVASGVYVYRIQAGSFQQTLRALVVR